MWPSFSIKLPVNKWLRHSYLLQELRVWGIPYNEFFFGFIITTNEPVTLGQRKNNTANSFCMIFPALPKAAPMPHRVLAR
jgi:hypothetical protein